MHQINPQTLISEIKSNMRAGINTMVWGGPGIGKSDIPQQVADQMGLNLILIKEIQVLVFVIVQIIWFNLKIMIQIGLI